MIQKIKQYKSDNSSYLFSDNLGPELRYDGIENLRELNEKINSMLIPLEPIHESFDNIELLHHEYYDNILRLV